ncbi:MAG: PD-(D/E)XK nuclease family protein [Gallionella sp.]|nr:PD-(D/E)XK nuclease family protein [Gallionella sp.]
MNPAFYLSVAQEILAEHAPPNLRGVTILLPNYHAAQPLAQALIAQAARPALLLPEMLTLSDWAGRIALPIDSDTQRIALLYQTLRDNGWFADAELWSLSRELLALIDELTEHHVALPLTHEEFSARLVEAYAARSGVSLQFEARVVHELWYAMAGDSKTDSVRVRQQRLVQIAEQISQPLYVLQTSAPSAPEAAFLQRCAERVVVTVFDLRVMVREQADQALIVSALQRGSDATDLRADALTLQRQPVARLSGALSLYGAHGLEQEARAAEVQIRRWLLEGKQSIAVVVQDRLAARRVRALLERAQVQVQDESGWTFATLSVSTVLMAWLEALQNDFYYQDVLDLLKSPFLFADAASPQPTPPQAGEGADESLREPQINVRKQVAYLFEQMVRKQGVVSTLDAYLATSTDAELSRALARLRQAAAVLPKGRVTLSFWLVALRNSLEILGVLNAWADDAAGQQLLQLLGQWREELQDDKTRCSFAEWKRWLSQQLDLNTFRDMSVESPVRFTHLAATRWRRFDAVLLLGCDAKHLPAPSNSLWFNDAVRAALGLPLSRVKQDEVRDDLLALLALNDEVLVTWQAHQNGESNMLSSHFEMLRALHVLAYGDDLAAKELAELIASAVVRNADFALPDATTMPRPVLPCNLLPQRISPSGYNSLVACPYQFYARHALRLNDLDEVREDIDKRDYGTWVHAALQRFHEQYPLLLNEDAATLAPALQHISEQVFAEALAHDYLAVAWLTRWVQMIPAYLDWQLAREQHGWRYSAAEVPFETTVLDDLVLRGRIDRVDSDADGAECVLDYKTQSANVLKAKLREPGEDVQLACYAAVRDAAVTAFVSLEGKVTDVAPPSMAGVAEGGEVTTLGRLNLERLREVYTQMRAGTALPAHGAESACSYCEMRGLCRQGSWENGHE